MIGYIYQIENLQTGKSYVGQTINFQQRKNRHLSDLRRNKHHNKKLQNAFNKYGEQEFHFRCWKFEVKDEKELDALEEEYIEKYNAIDDGYNIEPAGGSPPHRQKTKNEDIIKFLCINEIFGDGYGKTCEEIFGWAQGTASVAKRRKGYLNAILEFEKLNKDEVKKIAQDCFDQLKIQDIKLKRELKQGGCSRAYKLTKKDYYYAFYMQEQGYGYTEVANILGIKPATVKDWFNGRSRKKEKQEYLQLTEDEKSIYRAPEIAELSGNSKLVSPTNMTTRTEG